MLATGQQMQSNTPSDAGALLTLSLLGNSIQKKKTLKITPSTFPFLLPLGFYVPRSERLVFLFFHQSNPLSPPPPALLLPILETEHKPRTVNRVVGGEM